MGFSFKEAPSVGKKSREAFFACLEKNIIHCRSHEEYTRRTGAALGRVPPSGVSACVNIERGEGFQPIGYRRARIFVDDDYYTKRFGGDYTSMSPYDVGHDMWEIYFATKTGYNPHVLDLKEGKRNSLFGRPHYLAIRKVLRKADREGRLDDYLFWEMVQLNTFQVLGDRYTMTELAYYQREAEKIKKLSKKQKK